MGNIEALVSYERAVKKSQEKQSMVSRISSDHYVVHSESGNSYNVNVIRKSGSTIYECECLGYQFGHTCWHCAKIASQSNEVENRSWGMPTIRNILDQMDQLPEIGLRHRCPSGYTIQFIPVS